MFETLKKGSTGEEVKKLQKWLNEHGFDCGSVDGNFGPKTENAVKKLQKEAEIVVDGIVGKQTREAISQWELEPIQAGWRLLKCYTPDYQDTHQTCGPSSLKMAMGCHDLDVDEMWIAKVAGTTEEGTSHEGLFNVIKAINKKYRSKYKIWDENLDTFNSLWNKYLSKGIPVIIHYQTKPLPNWWGDYAHYSILEGVSTNYVRIICPVKGRTIQEKKHMKKAMNMKNRPVLPVK